MRTYRKDGLNPLRISYHSSSHYNSIMPQTQILSTPPGEAEARALSVAGLRSNEAYRVALRTSDREDIEQQTIAAALEISKETEKRPVQKRGNGGDFQKNRSEAGDDVFGRAVGHCVENFGFTDEESVEAYSFVTNGRDGLDFESLVAEMAGYVFEQQQRL